MNILQRKSNCRFKIWTKHRHHYRCRNSGISDPGYLLGKACADEDLEMICFLVQLLLFLLWWFLVCRITIFISQDFYLKKRQTNQTETTRRREKTIVLYESPHKINTTLEQIKEFLVKILK
jgi:16S rRNA (cytidine1402-2'-O)-methyltransferase